jgi:hypothetical protein
VTELYIYEKIRKNIRERREMIRQTLCEGPVPDFTTFKELRARLVELAAIEQEIASLLEKVTDD